MPFPYTFPIIFDYSKKLNVVIGDEVPALEKGSTSIQLRVEERGTARFVVYDRLGTAIYQRGQPVIIYDTAGALIFGGFIDNPGRARMGPTGSILRHPITCMDNHYLADKRLVIKSYSGQTLEYIVEDILTDYLIAEGIHENTAGDIEKGPTIDTAVFNYVSVTEAFDALAELSGFTWYIDENKHLYFTDRSTNAAAWNLDMDTYKPIKGSVRLEGGNPLYRNKQYLRGGKGQTSSQVETFTGDAALINFTVGYPISTAPTVTVQDRAPEAQTVGIKGIDTGKDCYWNKSDATITFDVAPEAGKTVTITYLGEYPLIALAAHPTDHTARAAIEGGTGIVENMLIEAQHETAAAMQESAQGKISQYCREAEKFYYSTTDRGLKVGALQEITFAPFGFSAHEMMIESIGISLMGDVIIYEVVCITGPSMGSWAKFFASLVTQSSKALRVGDSNLVVLLQTAEQLEMTESTSIDEDEFAVSGNVNRWLNAAPISAGSLYNIQHERLEMTESNSIVEHLTEAYDWDDADALWGFATWA